MASSSSVSAGAPSKKSLQEAVNQFNAMREEQRQISMRISQVEMEAREHTLVIEVLEKVPPERKCFRMIGGVLVERTAGEILPILASNRDQMVAMVAQLKTRMAEKGREINDFKEKHGIRFSGEGQSEVGQTGGGSGGDGDKGAGGVLVA